MKARVLCILIFVMLLGPPVLAQEEKGSLDVTTVPDNATVIIDGQLKGTTPLTISVVTAGKHRLVIKKEGYKTVERIVNVPPDDIKRIRIALEKIVTRASRERRPLKSSLEPGEITDQGKARVEPEPSLNISFPLFMFFTNELCQDIYDNPFGIEIGFDIGIKSQKQGEPDFEIGAILGFQSAVGTPIIYGYTYATCEMNISKFLIRGKVKFQIPGEKGKWEVYLSAGFGSYELTETIEANGDSATGSESGVGFCLAGGSKSYFGKSLKGFVFSEIRYETTGVTDWYGDTIGFWGVTAGIGGRF